jgi:hypothetical protein
LVAAPRGGAFALKIIVAFWRRNAQECDTRPVTCGTKTAKTIVKPAFSRHPPPVTRHPENVQKKIKKNVDALLAFWQIGFTHGNNRTTTQNKMRTKTLLLSAAALLAAGMVTSQAQVYSQNIVGYATLASPSSFMLMTVPFQIGVSNGANEIFGTNLPAGTQIYTWNQAGGKFVINYYDPGAGGPGTTWLMADDGTPTNPPILPPGKGFFLLAAGAVTNTFAGTVAVNVGSSNVMALPSSFALVGSVIPSGGPVTNSLINLTNVPAGSQLYLWDQTHGKYIIDYYDPGAGGPGTTWLMSDDGTPTNTPSITIGQGFFLLPASPFNWQENLPAN